MSQSPLETLKVGRKSLPGLDSQDLGQELALDLVRVLELALGLEVRVWRDRCLGPLA